MQDISHRSWGDRENLMEGRGSDNDPSTAMSSTSRHLIRLSDNRHPTCHISLPGGQGASPLAQRQTGFEPGCRTR
jgi:hypothetical protein